MLRTALAVRGIVVTPRRLEGWVAAGLGPLSGTPHDQQAAHFEALSRLAGQGRTADGIALGMAANGYPRTGCETPSAVSWVSTLSPLGYRRWICPPMSPAIKHFAKSRN